MLKRMAVALAVLLALAGMGMIVTPEPAQAFSPEKWGQKIIGTVVDTVFVWTECPKAAWQEVTRWRERYIVGVPVTAALGCAVSTGARTLSTAGDWVTNVVPVTTEHLAKPRIYESVEPLVSIPTK